MQNFNSPKKPWMDVAGEEAAFLSAVEIGLGSLLHAAKVPFTGFSLSLNQGFFLTRAVLKTRKRTLPLIVSNIVAVLKSLSPAGQKLTPMLAISMQGFLYTLGTFFGGVNFIGIVTGFFLLSLWAFLQPLALYYLLFGKDLFNAGTLLYKALSKDLSFQPENWLWVLGILVGLKWFLALGLTFAAYFLPESFVTKYKTAALRAGEAKRRRLQFSVPPDATPLQKARLALRDLLNPLFLFSLMLTTLFFFWVEAPLSRTIWGLLRPVAVGFILFYAVRFLSFDRLVQRLEARGAVFFSRPLQKAIETLKQL